MGLPASIASKWSPLLMFFRERGRSDGVVENELAQERIKDEETRRKARIVDAEGPVEIGSHGQGPSA